MKSAWDLVGADGDMSLIAPERYAHGKGSIAGLVELLISPGLYELTGDRRDG